MSDNFNQPKMAREDNTHGNKDEMDIAALFGAIWQTRKLVAIVALLTMIGLMGLVAVSKFAYPTTQTFQYAIGFVFPGLARAQYPNKAPFASSDLLAPDVLQQVYKENDLEKRGIKLTEFTSAIGIYPYSPIYSAIMQRYKVRLSNKKLTFVERQRIEKQFSQELKTLNGKNALLRLSLSKRMGISQRLGEKLLHDVARQWAQISVQQRGVLKMPDALYKKEIVSEKIVQSYEPLVVVEILQDEIGNMEARLERLAALPGANTIKDKDSELSLAGVRRQLQLLKLYSVNQVRVEIIRGDYFPNRDSLLNVMQQRADGYELSKKSYEGIVSAIDTSYNLYSNRPVTETGRLSATAALERGNGREIQSGTSTQVGAGFIDRLIDLTKKQDEKKSDIDFRQKLILDRISSKEKAISAGVNEARTRQLIKRLQEEHSSAVPSKKTTKEEINKNMNEIVVRLNKMGAVISRLFLELSDKRISHNARLYVRLELPSDEKVSTHHPVLNAGVFSLVFLVTLGAAIFAMFAGLIWQMLGVQSRSK